jgi:hypothetical protein
MKLSFLLMILICLRKNNMVHSLLFSCLDSGWIMEDGLIYRQRSLNISVELILLQLCYLPLVAVMS